MKKNTEAVLEASKNICLEVNTDKTKYMVESCHKNVGQNHNLLISSKFSEHVAKFNYFVKTVRNEKCIYEEIKSR
jgi:hypothetical protein